jgi:hypothetical protein
LQKYLTIKVIDYIVRKICSAFVPIGQNMSLGEKRMKKVKISMLILLLLISSGLSAELLKGKLAGVNLRAIYASFSDPNFETCLRKILGKESGRIAFSEISAIKEFSCNKDLLQDDLRLLFEGTKVFIGNPVDDFKISGKIIEGAFVPGIFDGEEFKAGIFKDGNFVYGINYAGKFLEGIFIDNSFQPGIQWKGRFLPGLYRDSNFIPGIIVEGRLVPGMIIQDKFVPGTFISKTNFIPGIFKDNGFIAGVFYGGAFVPGIFKKGVFKDGYSDYLGDGLSSTGILDINERAEMGGLIETDYTTEKLGGHFIPGIGQVGGVSSGSSSGSNNSGMEYVPGIGNVPTGQIGGGNVDLGNGTGDLGFIGGNGGSADQGGYFNGGVYIGTQRPDNEKNGGIGLPPGSAGEYDPATGKFMPNIHGNYAGRVGAKGDKSTSSSSTTKKQGDGTTVTTETTVETTDNGDGTATQKTTTKTTTTDTAGNSQTQSKSSEKTVKETEVTSNGEICGNAKPGEIFGNNKNGEKVGAFLGGAFGLAIKLPGATLVLGTLGAFYGSRYWKGCGGQPADPWLDAPGIPEAFTSDFYPADIDGAGGNVFIDLHAYPADIDGPGGNIFYPADFDSTGGPIFLQK